MNHEQRVMNSAQEMHAVNLPICLSVCLSVSPSRLDKTILIHNENIKVNKTIIN